MTQITLFQMQVQLHFLKYQIVIYSLPYSLALYFSTTFLMG